MQKKTKNHLQLAFVAAAVNLFIAACGGGGDVQIDSGNDVFPNPGNTLTPTRIKAKLSSAMTRNGARQFNRLASHSENGTPATVEIENAVATNPLALARRA